MKIDDVVTKTEKRMLRWFGHLKTMHEEKFTKHIYESNVNKRAGKGRPERTYHDQIEEVKKKRTYNHIHGHV